MSTPLKLLVVDGTAEQRSRIVTALSDAGFEVDLTEAAPETVSETFAGERFDLIAGLSGEHVEALRAQDARFRALINNTSDLIAIIDANGTVLYESPAIEKMLGYTPDEVVGTNALDDIHPADQASVMMALQRAVESEEGEPVRTEYRMRHKDGTWRNLETIGVNLLGDPAVRGIVVNSRDVTDRKRIESQLDQTQRLASLGRLAAMVAHEFNNVLMGIQPFAEIVQRHAGGPGALADASEQIQASIRRGRTITQEILRFTRARELKRVEIDIESWLEGLRVELTSLITGQQTLRIEVREPTVIIGDPGQLAQVLTNLVINARDAMSPSGTVFITAGNAGPGTGCPEPDEASAFGCISVRDDGSGIAPDVLENVFDPLFTTKRGGTGLGLPNAQLIVERHGGRISVESEPEQGAVFHVLLPRLEQYSSNAAAAERDAPARPPSSEGKRILLVEDDPSVGPGMTAVLEMEGFLTHLVDTGGACIPAVRNFQPDVVVLDVGLPDIDGMQVYSELTRLWPALPVILSTGHGDRSRIDQTPHGARFGFLQKPYPINELISLIAVLTA